MRLVDLGPRPRPAEAEPVSLSELLAGGIRRRWTLARVAGGTGRGTYGTGVEVVDTDTGLWIVGPGDDNQMASPSNPTAVWREIVRLVRPRGAASLLADQPVRSEA